MGKIILKILLIIVVFYAAIAYDVSQNGSLESSKTGRVLKDLGILLHVKPYYNIIEEQTILAYRWCSKNFPRTEYDEFKNKTIEISSQIGKDVVRISKDGYAVTKTYATLSYNWVAASIPPDFSEKVVKFLSAIYEIIVTYTKQTANYLSQIAQKLAQWLKQNVARENLTWENVEKSFFQFAQTIKFHFTNLWNWVSRKVVCVLTA